MNLFQSVRNLFGLKTTVDESQPIDILEKAIKENLDLKDQLRKEQESFDVVNNNFELKILACDKLIEKGSKEGELNKEFISDRLSRITDMFLEKAKDLSDKIKKSEDLKNELESDIIAKSVNIVAALSSEDQSKIQDIIETWSKTSLIKGEEIQYQSRAIVTAIDEVLKATDEIELVKAEAMVPTGNVVSTILGDFEQQEVIDLEGHYANVIVNRTFKEGDLHVQKILFLKRSPDKVIAPNQYCLPGGHIDADETIEQAGVRELKEEANLDADGAYIAGKAKCDNGKWAFYLRAYPQGDVMLLDGENINACWMTQKEWMEADLFFDLKDHLLALETCSTNIDNIPTVQKAQDGFEDEIIKAEGSRGGKVIGHTKSGKPIYESEYSKKDSSKKKFESNEAEGKAYNEVKQSVKNSKKEASDDDVSRETDKQFEAKHGVKYQAHDYDAKELKTHAENTSSDQLGKVAKDKSREPHVRDAAKREVERRAKEHKPLKLSSAQHKDMEKHHASMASKYEKIGNKEQASLHSQLAKYHKDNK